MNITTGALANTLAKHIFVKYLDKRMDTPVASYLYRDFDGNPENDSRNRPDTPLLQMAFAPRIAPDVVLESGEITNTGHGYVGVFMVPDGNTLIGVDGVSIGDIIEQVGDAPEYLVEKTFVITSMELILQVLQVTLELESGKGV